MKRYSLFLFTSTACLLLLSGCGKIEQNYFPLQEGMQWSYHVTKTIRGKTEKQKYIFVNLPDDKLNDEPVSIRKSMDGTTLYYRETKEGLLLIGRQIQSGRFSRDERYVFRYPLEKDAQWQEITTTRLLHKIVPPIKKRVEFTTEIAMSARIEATDDTVNVPAGIYSNCIKIMKQGSKHIDIEDYKGNLVGETVVNVHETSWYALGVGLVKFIREEKTESHTLQQGDIVIELESFDA